MMSRKRKEANSYFLWGGYRWQLERSLHYEMAVVYGVFCGTSARVSFLSYNLSVPGREGGREGGREVGRKRKRGEQMNDGWMAD